MKRPLMSSGFRVFRGSWIACLFIGVGATSAVLDGSVEARSQSTTPEGGVQRAAGPPPDVVAAPEPVQREAYIYDPARRRDPFVSLLTRGAHLAPPDDRPAGLAGVSINDVSLRGLVLAGGVYLAVMQGPDNKTYILRGEEMLFDGVVKGVSGEGRKFLEGVSNPLSIGLEREVVRMLHDQCDQEERR